MNDVVPSESFEPARRQAQALLAARLAGVPAPPHLPVRPTTSTRSIVAAAVVACLLFVSGAWAYMHHPHSSLPGKVAPPPSPIVVHAKSAAVPPPPPPIAAPAKPLHRRTRPKTTTTTQRFDDEPLGDVIFGQTKRTQPPLFNVEEYKARGVLVP